VAHERGKRGRKVTRGLGPAIAQHRFYICSDDFSCEPAARAFFLFIISPILSCASTQTFTQSFYRLLAHPEYIEPLRQEVEAVVAEEGWTRAGMDKMHKIDSFVRESQRMDGPIISTSISLALSQHSY
jgi:cytochrome P450